MWYIITIENKATHNKTCILSAGTYMDINEAINELAETLVELIERDRNYTRIKVFVQNRGDTELQKEWDSLTEKEQRAVADELYYHFRSANT